MTFEIGAILAQDGLATGSIYILMAVALVLIFTVTRIVFVPQGDFVAFSALTLAALQAGDVPGTVFMLALFSGAAVSLDLWSAFWKRDLRDLPRALFHSLVLPGAAMVLAIYFAPKDAPIGWLMLVTIVLVTCLSPILYRVAFQPIAAASPLTLLIAAIAVHFGLDSLGLHFFGAEGVRTPGFSGPPIMILGNAVTRQSIGVVVVSGVIVLGLYLFFTRSLTGKALTAAACNRRGAEILGIDPARSGRTAFTVAGFVGSVAGLLIGPMTTLSYDSGFILGLKGFVGAIVGGLSIYPLAALGAVIVGLGESFSSFYASAYRDVLVFTMIIPILLLRSMSTPHIEEDPE